MEEGRQEGELNFFKSLYHPKGDGYGIIPYDIVRYSLEMRRVWDKEPILNGPFLLIEGKFISIGKANTYKWTFFTNRR